MKNISPGAYFRNFPVFASRPDWFTCVQISACIVIGSVKEKPAQNITLPSLIVFSLVLFCFFDLIVLLVFKFLHVL